MEGNNELIRIMSYNIRYDNPQDGDNRWKYRKELVASMIRFHRADIVGMQEVLINQLEDLAGLLPEYNWIGVGRDDGRNKGEFAAIFYLKNRFMPSAYDYFWLCENPEIPGTKGWDAACIRVATWADFTDRLSGKSFYHFNTHFDHVGKVAQRESALLLLNKIKDVPNSKSVLVTGDFNCQEDDLAYMMLTGYEVDRNDVNGIYLWDAKYTSKYMHHGPSWTFNDFQAQKDGGKIDYIFVNNKVKVIHHGILSDHFDWKFSSDHMPVIADILI